jgi:Ca2+-binding RTX toxin-like protein
MGKLVALPTSTSEITQGNGMDGADIFYGNNLGDQAYGFGGNDVLRGGSGADLFDGGADNDTLFGGSGNDTLLGGTGDDSLQGDAGDDTLTGGTGADVLFGGAGADILTGGSGKDTFVWKSTSDFASRADQITDFARGDKIDLSALDANSTKSGDQAFSYIGSKAFSHHAGELQVQALAGGNWLVSADTDGNGKADFTIQVHSSDPIVANDFNF